MAKPANILIVGGGPAGAATALVLAARGLQARVVDAGPKRLKVGETLPPSASALLQTFGLLSSLTEPQHLLCHGNRFVWASEEVQDKSFFHQPQGHGWHLDRARFEELLRRRARQAGQAWTDGCRFKTATRRGDGWWVTLTQDGRDHQVAADLVVDACGRAAPFARTVGVQRQRLDRLVGVAAVCPLAPRHGLAQYTHIEAVEDGWWYAAVIPGRRLMVVFMTDGDLLDRSRLEPRRFLDAARRAPTLRPLLETATAPAEVFTRDAASSRLQQVAGNGWLAVGDAAMAYDPISSHGLTSALGSGFYAGHAIADTVAGASEALPAYALLLEQGYEAYLGMVHRQYQLEQRWPRSPFWRRRRNPRPAAAGASNSPIAGDRRTA